MTACVVGESGGSDVGGPSINVTRDANSCVSKGEHSAASVTAQEDNGRSGEPQGNASCVTRPTVHLTAGTDCNVSKDEHSAIATQQEDNGRSGGSGDNTNMDCSTEQGKTLCI